MPAVHGLIWQHFPQDQVAVIAVNQTGSVNWLAEYAAQRGITFPFIYDEEGLLYALYEVSSSLAYVIIDQHGVVRYRYDGQYDRYNEIQNLIEDLLNNAS